KRCRPNCGSGDAVGYAAVSLDSTPPEPRSDDSSTAQRAVALLEVLICSDYPTQLAIGATFNAIGYGPYTAGRLELGYVVALSLIDSCVLVGLVLLFLHAHGERPRDVLLGWRPIRSELAYGVPLILIA